MRGRPTQHAGALPAVALALVLVGTFGFCGSAAVDTAAAANTLVLDQFTEDTGVVRDVLPWHDMFQSWRPTWSGPLARIDLLMGSKTPCRRFSGALRVEEVLGDAAADVVRTAVLLEQPVETTCASCEMTEQTCIMTGACRHSACVAWQQWHLQNAINVEANRTYLFRIRNWAPLAADAQAAAPSAASHADPPREEVASHPAVPSVAVAPPSANHGGRSSLPLNRRIAHQMTQFTFRTIMARGPRHAQPPVFPVTSTTPSLTNSADEPSANEERASLSTTSIVLVVVIVVLVVAAAATGLAVRRSVNARAKIGLDTLPQTAMDSSCDARSKVAWSTARRAVSERVSVYTHHVIAVDDEDHADTTSVVNVDALRIVTDQDQYAAGPSVAAPGESHKPSSVAWRDTSHTAAPSDTHVVAPRHIDVSGLSPPASSPPVAPEPAVAAALTSAAAHQQPRRGRQHEDEEEQSNDRMRSVHAWGSTSGSAVTASSPRTRRLLVGAPQQRGCLASTTNRGQPQAPVGPSTSSAQCKAAAARPKGRSRRRPRKQDVIPLEQPETLPRNAMVSPARQPVPTRASASLTHAGDLPGSAYAWPGHAVAQMDNDDATTGGGTRRESQEPVAKRPAQRQRRRRRGDVSRVRQLPSTPSCSDV